MPLLKTHVCENFVANQALGKLVYFVRRKSAKEKLLIFERKLRSDCVWEGCDPHRVSNNNKMVNKWTFCWGVSAEIDDGAEFGRCLGDGAWRKRHTLGMMLIPCAHVWGDCTRIPAFVWLAHSCGHAQYLQEAYVSSSSSSLWEPSKWLYSADADIA